MPVCAMCNSEEFACLDGKFFCVECDTQSQDFVDEQAPELLGDNSFTTKQLKKRKEKRKIDKGLPWRTVEGFQLIIKAHVQALIDLGIDPAIDSVMQQIWFKYVHKAGLAVLDRNVEVAKSEDAKFRDYFLEQFKEDVLPKQSMLKLRISKAAKRKVNRELDGGQDWLSVDTDTSDDQGDGASTSCSESSRISKRTKNNKAGQWFIINIMSKMKVICFCYLALRWCGEPITIGDLIHWVETRKLPYYGAVECFLPHMKIMQSDHETFVRIRVLEHNKVMWMSDALFKYLGMPVMPKFNIEALITRYLFQLNLPLALEVLANRLLSEIKRWPHLPRGMRSMEADVVKSRDPALTAAALIAIVMKLLFVLNDKNEWQVDVEESCRVHGGDEEKCSVFTWKNWVRQHLLQQQDEAKNSFTLFDRRCDAAEVGDVHACMENYLSVISRGALYRSEAESKSIKEHSEVQQYVFKHLVEKQGSAEEKLKKSERRRSLSSCYKLMGRGAGTDTQDFTSACVSNLGRKLSGGTRYVKYATPVGKDKMSELHQSYVFLLRILGHLTYADVQSIHDYVWVIESITVDVYDG